MAAKCENTLEHPRKPPRTPIAICWGYRVIGPVTPLRLGWGYQISVFHAAHAWGPADQETPPHPPPPQLPLGGGAI